ncbi:GNAT family N-acetyltransferase [soil metagenome]
MTLDRLTIRPVTEEEYPAFVRAVARQFGDDVHDDDITAYRTVTDLDRTLGAFDGDRIVGTTETISFDMSVPGGGTVSCGGVSAVGVRTTHRRQGLLTALMRRQLDDADDRGEPFTALYASEAPIYGRFGYGPAGPSVSVKAPRADLGMDPPADPSSVELVEADEAIRRCPGIYEAVRAQRPGMMSRTDAWWRFAIGRDEERRRRGASARYHAILGDRGYATYRIKTGWTDNGPDGTLQVSELIAADGEAEAALWAFLASVDLITTIEAHLRPADDVLPVRLANTAKAKVEVSEPLYVRLVRVAEALTARAYPITDALVLDVRDPFREANTGRWRLEAGPDGSTCKPTDDDADLALDVSALAAVSLGGVTWTRLARAGRITAHTPGALARADRLFATALLPWNPAIF